MKQKSFESRHDSRESLESRESKRNDSRESLESQRKDSRKSPHHALKIAFIHHYGLGDSIVCADALYMLRHAYNAEVVIFGNAIMRQLFYDFCVIDIGELSLKCVDLINSYHFDFVVLTNARKRFVKILEASNAKKIITPTKFYSLFSTRCATVPLYVLPKYRTLCMREYHLKLVSRINQARFNEALKSAKFPQIAPKSANRMFAKNALDSALNSISAPPQRKKIVMINPFSNAATHTLKPLFWVKLVEKVARIYRVIIVIPPRTKGIEAFCEIQGVGIIHNNNDLLNLVAILECVDLLISPSTGNIHLASHLKIPTIGLYSKLDCTRWATRDKRYVILPREVARISDDEQTSAIEKTLTLVCDLLK